MCPISASDSADKGVSKGVSAAALLTTSCGRMAALRVVGGGGEE